MGPDRARSTSRAFRAERPPQPRQSTFTAWRHHVRTAALLGALLALRAVAALADPQAPAAEASCPACVRIFAYRTKDTFDLGTGVIASDAGHVVVAAPFVEGALRLLVLDGGLDEQTYGRPATLVGVQGRLALLSVPGLRRTSATFSGAPLPPGASALILAYGSEPGDPDAVAADPTATNVAVEPPRTAPAPGGGVLLRPSARDGAPPSAGPLADACRTVVGFTVRDEPNGTISAEPGAAVVDLLQRNRVAFRKSDAPCTRALSTPPSPPSPTATTEASAEPVSPTSGDTWLWALLAVAGLVLLLVIVVLVRRRGGA